MRIAVAATPEVAIPTLDALLASRHQLVCVITKPDAPAGRGRALQATTVADWAERNNVTLYKPDSSELIGELTADLDLVVTIGFGLLLPLEILEKPRHGFINLHFSLLPRWRGAAPVQRAIEAGDSVTGVTVFQLDAGMDTGPIYTSAQIPLSVSTTADQLFQSLAILGVEPVLQTLELVERGERPTAQENAGASRAYKLSKEEGRIDWSLSAEVINRKVNAFNPAPGAWSNFRGQVIKIDKVRFSDQIALAGQLKVVEKSIYIGTATSALELLEVTPSGKAKMTAASWANGARLGATDMLQ